MENIKVTPALKPNTLVSRRKAISGTLLLLPLLLADGVSLAEEDPGYDVVAETSVVGTVVRLQEVPGNSVVAGIHLMVTAKGQEIDTYLGPADFLKDFDVTF